MLLHLVALSASVLVTAAQPPSLLTLHLPPAAWTITARPVSVVAGTVVGEMTMTCQPPAECALPLAPGRWLIRGSASGLWLPETMANVSAGSTALDMRAVPAGVINGRYTLRSPTEAPPPLRVMFHSVDPSTKDVVPMEGEVQCQTADGAFACQLPQGTFDLRLHAASFVSRYRWNVRVGSDPVELGEIALVRGASLVGNVDFMRGVRGRLDRTEVLLLPAARLPVSQQAVLTLSARPNGKGFFQFEGLTPGEFTLVARSGALASEPRSITILADREARLLEPLLLDTAKVVEIHFTPPLDPWSKPWRVRWSDESGARGAEDVSPARVDGQWTRSGLRRGDYSAAVLDHSGTIWLHRGVEVGTVDTVMTIAVPHVELRGKVTLGGKPIAAEIRLSSDGGASLKFSSGEDGTFGGIAPAGVTVWKAVVESEALLLARSVHSVTQRSLEGTDTASVEINLPSTQVSGRVFDEQNRPVRRAIIDFIPDDRASIMVQVPLLPDGIFTANALRPGGYRVQAHGPDGDSDPMPLDLAENAVIDDLRLTVHAGKRVVIEVTSDGGPVAGATVETLGVENPAAFIIPRPTDADGRAAVDVQGGNANVDVLIGAGGFAMRQFRMRRPERDAVGVRLSQIGGRLRLRYPAKSSAYVVHDRAVFAAPYVGTPVANRDGTLALTSGLVETGPWALCAVAPEEVAPLRNGTPPPGRCTVGLLAPGAELALEIGEAKP